MSSIGMRVKYIFIYLIIIIFIIIILYNNITMKIIFNIQIYYYDNKMTIKIMIFNIIEVNLKLRENVS